MLHLEASIVDFELRRAREAEHTIGERVEQVHHDLRHCTQRGVLPLMQASRHGTGVCRYRSGTVESRSVIQNCSSGAIASLICLSNVW